MQYASQDRISTNTCERVMHDKLITINKLELKKTKLPPVNFFPFIFKFGDFYRIIFISSIIAVSIE